MRNLNKNVWPLLALSVASLYTVYVVFFEPIYIEGEPYEQRFSTALYAGFAVLLTSLGLYWTKSRYFKYFVLLLLLLWLFGLTSYLPTNMGIGMGAGEVGVSLQLGAILFILIYYLLNRQRANAALLRLIATKPDSAKAKQQRRENVDKFKKSFRNHPTDKLQAIVAESKLVSDAIMAAQELLNEQKIG